MSPAALSTPTTTLPDPPKCLDRKIKTPGWLKTRRDPDWSEFMKKLRREYRELVAYQAARERERPSTRQNSLDKLKTLMAKLDEADELYEEDGLSNEVLRERARAFALKMKAYKMEYSHSLTNGDFQYTLNMNESAQVAGRKSSTPPKTPSVKEEEEPSSPGPTPTRKSFARYTSPVNDGPKTARPSMQQPMNNMTFNFNHGLQEQQKTSPPPARSEDWPELRNCIAKDNLYDSGHVNRSSVPKLELQAMDSAIGSLADWFSSVDRTCCIHWLCGPTASGKTALMQHVVERCIEIGQPTASFFFTEHVGHHIVTDRLVPTVTHDIIRCMAQESEYFGILGWLRTRGPSSLGLRMEKQVVGLVKNTFKLLQKTRQTTPTPLLIVLDGLELCDTNALTEVFRFVKFCIQDSELPACFLISSKPNDVIEDMLSSEAMTH
ncbi:hypothetical protein D9611_000732 [Ephemerocybe angulata]|uniref:Nephrocystin 3-like N-terminal domain-containing protein n=1 Tax=Ephemerocybe angulata TaxID=980116 RepID=A0A8H5F7N1_9AGAR|nr:hypothetical protein D9611_000732 [Tulosesus angulatus]